MDKSTHSYKSPYGPAGSRNTPLSIALELKRHVACTTFNTRGVLTPADGIDSAECERLNAIIAQRFRCWRMSHVDDLVNEIIGKSRPDLLNEAELWNSGTKRRD